MQRVIQPEMRFHSEEISPGVSLERFHPGGKAGPDGEILFATRGGQAWSEIILLGDEASSFQMALPDIRLPPNQLWPLHWHDCWTVVVILEGECLIGDWWLKPGEVFVAEPSIEYGPLESGPQGCRLFEIFAQLHLSPGGFAPEYRDHPTLEGLGSNFLERSDLNRRNEGRSSLSCEGVKGLSRSRLEPAGEWVLGAPDDPDRGLLRSARLSAGESIPGRRYEDWSAIVVLEGSLTLGATQLGPDDFLRIQPGGSPETLTAGPAGAHIIALYRTAPASGLRSDDAAQASSPRRDQRRDLAASVTGSPTS